MTVACVHEWRLRKEGPWLRDATVFEIEAHAERMRSLQQPGHVLGWVPLRQVAIGTERHWYCVHCRMLETTYHEETW